MSGPPPSEQRRRRNLPAGGEWIDLPNSPGKVPPLPDGEWSAGARGAWSSWWSDPAASRWTAADWEHVVQLLVLTEAFNAGEFRWAAEMRLRADGLGLTQKGKRNLRWRVADGADEMVEPPPPAAARRRTLHVVAEPRQPRRRKESS